MAVLAAVVGSGGLTLQASDGVAVYGTEYRAASGPRAVVLLFHQAESSAAEYDPIWRAIPPGYAGLAIDQRSGDGMYGPNRTAQALGRRAGFLEAVPDLEAALKWAHQKYPGKPVILCGSSYSAALVFLVAAKHPSDVAAVIAFSPGEYFDDKMLVRRAASQVHVPIFVDSAADREEIASARAILAAAPSQ